MKWYTYSHAIFIGRLRVNPKVLAQNVLMSKEN